MSQRPTCPVCGFELPAGATTGFCPKCLLLQARGEGEGGPTPPVNDSQPSTLPQFGGYELLERIGQGGMGIVYRARQISLDRIVALKVLPHGALASKEQVLRFRTEAAAAGSLQHPNIVAIHEVGLCEDRHYLVMDFVEGQTLAQVISNFKFQVPDCRRAARYIQKIAEAVHYAHERGILHRDLKPSNVMIDTMDEPRVTDFGLAKRLESATDLTLSGQVLGSPQYMPPEQAAGRHRQVGRRSDVYALGATLYHLLTGRPPFLGETLADLLPQATNDEPLRPRQLNPAIPVDLETICLQCLEKEVHRRYPTALALAEELRRFLRGESIEARPLSAAGKAWRRCRRKPQVAAAVAVAVVAAFAGVMGITWEWRRATAGEALARQNAQAELQQRQRTQASEYAADMNLAQHALDEDNVALALNLLNRHRPGVESKVQSPRSSGSPSGLSAINSQSSTDLRGWEWRYLWQLCQPGHSAKLQTNPSPVLPLAISPDGKVEAAQIENGKIAVWDLSARQLMAELAVSGQVRALSLSRNSRLLGISKQDARGGATVEIRNARTGEPKATFRTLAPVRSLAFSPDEVLLATFDDRGTNEVQDWAAHRTLTSFTVPAPGHDGVGIVAFSPDGGWLAVGQDYGRLRLLNLQTGICLTVTNLTQEGHGVGALAFSPTTTLLAAAFGQTICLWDFVSQPHRERWINNGGEIGALAFGPDGKVLAAGGGWAIRLWSVADQVQLGSWRGHQGEGQALAFLPDGKTLVSGCGQSTACFWDWSAVRRSPDHAELTNSYALGSQAVLEASSYAPGALDPKVVRRFGFEFTPDGRSFLTTDRDGWLDVGDTRTWKPQERLPGCGSNLWGLALSPDGRRLATGTASGTIEIWDWHSRSAITNLALPFEWFGTLHFSRNGHFLIAASIFKPRTACLKIWRTSTWAEVSLISAQVARGLSPDVSLDDQHLAIGYLYGAVKMWSLATGELEAAFTNHTDSVTSVLFSPDDRALISAGLDGSVWVWNLTAHRKPEVLRGHLGGVWAAAFSPDGRRLATGGGGAKDAVKLWDLSAGREVLTLQGQGEYFARVAFSPDGSTVIGSSFVGVAHVWRAPSWEEIAAAEKGTETP